MPFKICAIGCGGMATMGHGPSFRKYAAERPDTELSACCDLSAEKAAAFASKFGFLRVYTDMDEMLRIEKPDALSLVVPVSLTAPLSVKLLRMGVPIILEKPPGMNREETLRMMEAADASATPNQVAFNRRHMPLLRALRECLQTPDHPTAHAIQYDFCRVNRRDADFSTTAIHGIDAVRFMAGKDYKTVQFTYQHIPGEPAHVANIFLDCRFTDGSAAAIRYYPLSGFVIERGSVHAVDRSYIMELPIWGGADRPGSLCQYDKGARVRRISGLDFCREDEEFVANGFYGENASFFDAVRAGKKPEDDIASGLQPVEIADCIRRRVEFYEK